MPLLHSRDSGALLFVLGRLVDKPEALMENPELIRRLRRLRAQRAAERHGDRNSWSVRGDDSVGDAIG